MRLLLLFSLFLFLKNDTHNRANFNAIDLTDDGIVMVGQSGSQLTLVDTRRIKAIDKYTFPKGGRLENVRISGDGNHVFWTLDWQLYYAPVKNGKIGEMQPLNVGRAWLDLEVNYDGTAALVSVDYPDHYADNTRQCSPGKRLIMKILRDGRKFKYSLLNPTERSCQWLNYAELMPDGTIIYEFTDGYDDSKFHLYEAIPDGDSDWGYRKIGADKDRFAWQSMTNDGRFLTYQCSLYLNSKDNSGKWTIREDILPDHDYCAGPWWAAISPDGTKVVWLRYLRDDNQQITQSDFMITENIGGQWTTPRVLLESFGTNNRFPQIKTCRISNSNFSFATWGGEVYLIRLNGDSDVIKVEDL